MMKAIAEKVVQLGAGVKLGDGRIDIVWDTAKPDELAVKENVARAPVAIPRLPYRTDVADHLPAVEPIGCVTLIWVQLGRRTSKLTCRDLQPLP
jgi:hypothetical protein